MTDGLHRLIDDNWYCLPSCTRTAGTEAMSGEHRRAGPQRPGQVPTLEDETTVNGMPEFPHG